MMESCKAMDPNKAHKNEDLQKNYHSFTSQFSNAVSSSKTNCNGILNVDTTQHLPKDIQNIQKDLIHKFDTFVKEEEKEQKEHAHPKTKEELHHVSVAVCNIHKEVEAFNAEMNKFVGKVMDHEDAEKVKIQKLKEEEEKKQKEEKKANSLTGKAKKIFKKSFVEWF